MTALVGGGGGGDNHVLKKKKNTLSSSAICPYLFNRYRVIDTDVNSPLRDVIVSEVSSAAAQPRRG